MTPGPLATAVIVDGVSATVGGAEAGCGTGKTDDTFGLALTFQMGAASIAIGIAPVVGAGELPDGLIGEVMTAFEVSSGI